MITEARLERDGTDFVVSWRSSEPVNISVLVGPEPDGPVATHVAQSDESFVRFTGLDQSQRHYVRFETAGGEAIVTAERLVPLEGAVNFRDVGGYLAGDARRVRWGRIYRSDNLGALTTSDVDMLEILGVKTICDLRREEERATTPSLLPQQSELDIVHLPIGGVVAETATMTERMMRGEIRELSADAMADVYGKILDLHSDSFGEVIRRAADPTSHALLVHCTAGKDRTGMASALLLGALGVADSTIADDYELTTRFQNQPRLAELRPQLKSVGIDFDMVEPYFTAPRAVMEATLTNLRSRYGSVEAYLTGPAQVSIGTLAALRHVMLEG